MTRRLRLSCLVSLLVLTTACASDRSHPPERRSPELEPVDRVSVPLAVLVDRMRAEPTWLDDAGQVWTYRGGRAERVQEGTRIPEEPAALRVFDDGSMAIATDDAVHVYSASGEERALDLSGLEVAIDGTSIDDLWVIHWPVLGEYELCHHTPAGDSCIPVPNVGGFTALLAAGPDGTAYVSDRDVQLLRFSDGALTPVAGGPARGLHSLRRSGDAIFGLAYDSGVYEIRGDRMAQRTDGHVLDVVGSSDEHFELRYDAEYVQVDPSCDEGWFTDCEERLLWSQTIVVRVRGDETDEIAHETCDDAHPGPCDRFSLGLGLDGDDVVVIGAPFRVASAR
ncbi:hypothetical protein [Sandaracinus amylolyticus]|uniref:hypothetical protein n=1 Tax=Sandaracinus amylolyticus TaxID=927083 RepID=UPI001F2E1839|nr:hypothetical protein [Sandaracinus amylolyticus]UJR82327.1 Hypothetical protein I5071_43920 [Sandaracinus amylolyticus]